MQLFSADATMFFKKINFFLPLKTWKNHPQKLLKIGLAAQTAKNRNPVPPKAP